MPVTIVRTTMETTLRAYGLENQFLARTSDGTITPEDGLAELDRIRQQPNRFPVFGSYASGFGGGLTLIICALAISHRPTGILLWRAAIQLSNSPNRRAMHE
jgi:hypothetical protein